MRTAIEYTAGDATRPLGADNRVIVHVCNDEGGWGKGFVVAISKRWPEPEARYREWYRERRANDFGLGVVQFVKVEASVWVVTKR
jgi:O-acetyl-ADP-ribose deacetylase (regulator of RNase III)